MLIATYFCCMFVEFSEWVLGLNTSCMHCSSWRLSVPSWLRSTFSPWSLGMRNTCTRCNITFPSCSSIGFEHYPLFCLSKTSTIRQNRFFWAGFPYLECLSCRHTCTSMSSIWIVLDIYRLSYKALHHVSSLTGQCSLCSPVLQISPWDVPKVDLTL